MDGVEVEVPLNVLAVVGVEVDDESGGVTPQFASVGKQSGSKVVPGAKIVAYAGAGTDENTIAAIRNIVAI